MNPSAVESQLGDVRKNFHYKIKIVINKLLLYERIIRKFPKFLSYSSLPFKLTQPARKNVNLKVESRDKGVEH